MEPPVPPPRAADRVPDRASDRAPVPARRRANFRERPVRWTLGFLFRLLCAPLILLDELVRPLYRPLIARLAALKIMHAFERWIAARSVWTILVLLIVPYATIEPLKFVALLWIAGGWPKAGTVLFLVAYLLSFVVIERIYSAGRAKLMTLPWMAWVILTLATLRDRVVAALRLDRLKASLRRTARDLRRRLALLLR
ncbi:hypothetical protein [Ancylobacter vacuolatus]|uniref:Uncharacterized protein n=1 Tax=Ancylobacter vacuolatus TaxID=223389 RepID=A0ABU0DED2_9HYPH|nr:hypothetical protein [Ancylobacter vacuolatus]MDQ0346645.1 hypothetical protein [Ancylobacter vacuolatus]